MLTSKPKNLEEEFLFVSTGVLFYIIRAYK